MGTGIVDYYDQCHSDYQRFWRIDKNLGFHYGFYDNGQKSHNKAVVRMNEVLALKARITSADRVLDAGCGIGGSAIWLAKNIGCRVAGINISDNQLGIAESLVKERQLGKLVKVYNMDFCNTEFPDSCFDVIWALESSCYAIDKLGFLKEAKRLLKENGRIVIADGFLAGGLSKPEREAVYEWLSGWGSPYLATASEFTGYLKDVGFKNILFEDITERTMPSSRRLYRAGKVSYPLCKLLELVGLRTKTQTRNIISAVYQYKILKCGLAKYGILTAQRKEV